MMARIHGWPLVRIAAVGYDFRQGWPRRRLTSMCLESCTWGSASSSWRKDTSHQPPYPTPARRDGDWESGNAETRHKRRPTRLTMTVPSKPEVGVLSQVINDENGHYRLQVGQRVHYLTISAGIFDEDIMCRPYLLIPRLPDLPDSPWTTMTMSQAEDGSVRVEVSTEPLPVIQGDGEWHEVHVDVLSLERMTRHRSGVHEVQYGGAPAIAKVACFGWEM